MSIYGVQGIISPENLGKTYFHEHLYLDLSRIKGDPDTHYNAVELIIDEMKNLKKLGISTIVEMTNHGMGRNLNQVMRVSLESGMQVIMSTGFYKEPFLPDVVSKSTISELVKQLTHEITTGIEGTSVRAQVIGEIGTSKDVMTPLEAKVFEIAARTHIETGAPIATHTTLGTCGVEQLDFLSGFGVDLSKVVIGHVDLNCEKNYHLKMADKGAVLAFDTIGKLNYGSDEIRAKHIAHLIERGHIDQIVLSQDMTRKSHLKANGGIGYGHLIEVFIPLLLAEGVGNEEIRKMLEENPKRILRRKE
ncbi:phosphotriesterase family protein [Fusibacter ferrireducens]|uniref:Phosphotriesterase-related protein n=1 Tax=Fusibacter ferrireducens TaxID=2785058 RepID=A0ABR9ZXM0_9FIRM|nr:phosphotriesterase-related protein [Fusibacter ferrireducens]MBF4695210.1 phosphotriesterase-related protein [Fusibacter ferrireducens]